MNVWLKDFIIKRIHENPFLIVDLNIEIEGNGVETNLRSLFNSKTLQESTDLKAALVAGEFIQFTDVYDNGECGLALEINWCNGTSQKLIADQDCVITFCDLNADQTCHLKLHIEHSTLGKRYFTWPSNVRWKDNIVPFFDGMKGSQIIEFILFNDYYLGQVYEDVYDDPDILFRTISQNRLSGIHNLSWCLDINGQKVFPDFVYLGKDATLQNWTPYIYGETLDIIGSGSEPDINNGSPLLGPLDDSVKFNAGKYHKASNGDLGNIVYEDFIYEMLFKYTDVSANAYYLHSIDTAGINIYSVTTIGILKIYLDGSLGMAQLLISDLVDNAIYHLALVCDRSGYAQCVLNGKLFGAPIDISGIGSMEDLISKLRFGMGVDTNIFYNAMWKKNDWLDTHDQEEFFHKRFLQIKGFMPNIAFGDSTPLNMERYYPAYLD